MANGLSQRRDSILTLLYQEGYVEVAALAEKLGVSEATVRRDLRSLADEGQLELSHGGASVAQKHDYSFISKSLRNIEAKRRIAQLASDLVQDGDQLFLDSGTTCFEMTKHLRARRGLSVIVSSTRMAQELVAPGLTVILLGGQYRPERMDMVGPLASATLDRLRGYKAFIGTDGLGMEFGPSSIDIESASLFGQAVQNARETLLLADHTKFHSPSLYRTMAWKDVTNIITDIEPDPNWTAFFAREGIHLYYPPDQNETAEPSALPSTQSSGV